MEVWKVISEYPRYEISSGGRVKNIRSGRLKKLSINSSGYFFVNLYKQDMEKPSTITVHRLVAKEFVDGDTSLTVNHKNGLKRDNTSANLEWISRADNSSHAWRNGLTPILSGENCGKSVLDESRVVSIRFRHSNGESQNSLAKVFGVTQANISAIVRRTTWKHI